MKNATVRNPVSAASDAARSVNTKRLARERLRFKRKILHPRYRRPFSRLRQKRPEVGQQRHTAVPMGPMNVKPFEIGLSNDNELWNWHLILYLNRQQVVLTSRRPSTCVRRFGIFWLQATRFLGCRSRIGRLWSSSRFLIERFRQFIFPPHILFSKP
jgi:hypothetical protein